MPARVHYTGHPEHKVVCGYIESGATRGTVDAMGAALSGVSDFFGLTVSTLGVYENFKYAQALSLPNGGALDFWVQTGFEYVWVLEYSR